MSIKLTFGVIAGLVLAGCTPTPQAPHAPAPPPPSAEVGGDCGAERVQERIGRMYSDDLGAAIQAESGAATLRVMRPGEAHTLDYRADRINIRLDESKRITSIGCG